MNMPRQSNLELLKIVAILMVIILHYFNADMGGGLKYVNSGTFNYYAMNYIESLSIIAVNCFVLITGYFLTGKETIRVKKVIDLVFVTIFYGLLFFFFISKHQAISLQGVIHAAIPFYVSNWYVASYCALYMLSPFLNILIRQLTKGQFQQLIIVGILFFSLVPTFLSKVSYNDNGYGVLSFLLLYCIGSYIKTYSVGNKSKWVYLTIYLLSTTITFIIFNLAYNTIFTVISSISLFLFFSKLSLHSKIINYLASFTFAVYIIHTNEFFTNIIFHKILKTQLFWNSSWFLLHIVFSVILVFIICMGIEIIRRMLAILLLGKIKIPFLEKLTVGTQKSF
ncbi:MULTISPECIES: acyltransferase [Priestia]|uniref:acyltransferase n=1 Tax=Priestia TaxID=2800373 RepID=UPI0024067C54|nr:MULTISPECIES: acyltransferase family protein [Priestia]MDG0060848.1 acyltransferase family protein [Priestia sp. P5]WDC89515.1 acyltransferase family protein [Priestia megaterium]